MLFVKYENTKKLANGGPYARRSCSAWLPSSLFSIPASLYAFIFIVRHEPLHNLLVHQYLVHFTLGCLDTNAGFIGDAGYVSRAGGEVEGDGVGGEAASDFGVAEGGEGGDWCGGG